VAAATTLGKRDGTEKEKEKEKEKAETKTGFAQKMKDMLHSGISPESLALSFACGFAGGIFPVPGLTTFPVLALVWIFKLSAPAAMLVNYCMTPLVSARVCPSADVELRVA
jgi:hypothetical protein